MRSRVLTVAAALASLWATAAWSASAVPNDGAGVTLAPGAAAASSPAGIFDPAFPATTVLFEPQATTIPMSLAGAANGVVSGATLHDVTLALAPDVELNLTTMQNNYDGWRSPFGTGGVYAGVAFNLADDLQLHIGHAAFGADAPGQNPLAAANVGALPPELALQLTRTAPGAETTSVGVEWAFADWGGLDLTASQTKETSTLLGDVATNSVAVANAIQTAALGISARVGFGDGWVTTVSYNQGISQLNLRPNTLLPTPEEVKTQSYGVTVAKKGLFGDDMLGLSLSRPAYGSTPSLMSGFADNGNSLLGNEWGLSAGAPESDIELGYVTSFLGGSLALQANAAYQMNAGGQRGQDAVTVVSRAKINF